MSFNNNSCIKVKLSSPFILLLLTGCINLGTFQTAQIEDVGHTEIGASISVADHESNGEMYYRILQPNLYYRFVLINNLKLGLVASYRNGLFEFTYQLVDLDNFDIAFNSGIEGWYAGSNGWQFRTYQAFILSKPISDKLVLTIVPKLIHQHSDRLELYDDVYIPGLNIGMRFGHFFPEIGYFKFKNGKREFFHYGLGVFF